MNVSIDSFPNSPHNWTIESAEDAAKENDITMSDDHWQLIAALQEYYAKAEYPKLRQIKDALEEKFHSLGGIKYLHRLIPSGPVAMGCKLAGLEVPAGAVDKSFGSVA
jgi:tRNA 2-thiouridine synthesizing protein E